MSAYTTFFLGSRADVKQLDAFEISHPNFTRTYRIVRNKVGGMSATIDSGAQTFDWYPMRVAPQSTRANLDYALKFDLGDLGEVIPKEIDAVVAADGMGTKPQLRYWTFRSDDLSSALFGPITLEIPELPTNQLGTSFLAQAAALNDNRTGENFLPSRFPMLAGFT